MLILDYFGSFFHQDQSPKLTFFLFSTCQTGTKVLNVIYITELIPNEEGVTQFNKPTRKQTGRQGASADCQSAMPHITDCTLIEKQLHIFINGCDSCYTEFIYKHIHNIWRQEARESGSEVYVLHSKVQ